MAHTNGPLKENKLKPNDCFKMCWFNESLKYQLSINVFFFVNAIRSFFKYLGTGEDYKQLRSRLKSESEINK